ncbi:MAG: ACP S-malonyltransferase [Acidimicrobiales bacterium]
MFTFPGQGSQRPGMGRDWVDHPSWEIVADASAAIGRDVAHLLLDADADELTNTRNAQVATFTLSLVALDAIERLGLAPAACAGHSLGEYTALVATGVLSFEDGVRLVAERGEAMQAAAEERPGTMAAILGLDDDGAEAACSRTEGQAWVANYNAPGQVVIAGTRPGVDRAGSVAKEMGAKRVMSIPVGGAFHTPLMAAARDRLKKALADVNFADPEIPVMANVDGRPHPDAKEWSGLLSAQLTSPVRWRQSMAAMVKLGPEPHKFVEVGPGGVLTGLAKRILVDSTGLSVSKPDDLDRLVKVLAESTPLQSYLVAHQGEHLYMSERVIVSPATGVFEPHPGMAPDLAPIVTGELVGTVGAGEIRSPFTGTIMGFLALSGERVVEGQPVAWLRTPGADA